MTVNQYLWQLLATSPAVIPSIGTRWSLEIGPQGVAKPYGVIREISRIGPIERELMEASERTTGMVRFWRFQFDVYGTDYNQVALAQQQLVQYLSAIEESRGGVEACLLLSTRPAYTETERLFGLSADFHVIESIPLSL